MKMDENKEKIALNHALELLEKGISIISLTGYLEEDNQLDRESASIIAKKAFLQFNLEKSNKMIGYGSLWFFLGIFATSTAFYLSAKNNHAIVFIFYGAIIWGGGQMVRGLIKRNYALKNYKS